MSSRYLVSDSLIPDDGSLEIVRFFSAMVSKDDTDTLVFPDIHYKKGAPIVNGLLTASDDLIYPAMMGVANCGFTFGKISNATLNNRILLEKSFENYSKVLGSNSRARCYSNEHIKKIFIRYLEMGFWDRKNAALLEYLGISSIEKMLSVYKAKFPRQLLPVASSTLGTLGGGNHFFEIYYVQESYSKDFEESDIYFILHSDSVAVGDRINLLFSNLSELHCHNLVRRFLLKVLNRIRQARYFLGWSDLLVEDGVNLVGLILGSEIFRTITASSLLGKAMLLNSFFASVFGEMNRDTILNNYEVEIKKLGLNFSLRVMGSHSHDSLNVEVIDGKTKIVQRNGVQNVKFSDYYCMPGALGAESYIMANTNNPDIYFSANHGVGRTHDKHIAKKEFSEEDTLAQLSSLKMKLYRVGRDSIGEQNSNAFKNVSSIVDEMHKQKIGVKAAKLLPIASLKG